MHITHFLCCPAIWMLCVLGACRAHAQSFPPQIPDVHIEPPVSERLTTTLLDNRTLLREIWEVPIHLVSCEMPETKVPPRILKQALDWDKRYFEHLKLEAQPQGETRATKPFAQIDAVKTSYTLGKLKVETRQTVWVWSLWIPFSEDFKKSEAPKNVNLLIPALQGKMVPFDSFERKSIYLSESAPADSELRIVNTMVTETGVLLWGMKGNWKTAGTPISSQMNLNEGWFRSAENDTK